MKIKENKKGQFTHLQHTAEKALIVEEKLDELIALLSLNEFDSETIKQYQQKLNTALEQKTTDTPDFDAFKIIDEKDNASREQLLNDFTMLLISNKVDSKFSSNYLRAERTNKIVLMILGVILIALGLAMIVMPAPPYFEMFTIYYFSLDDGITLMDLISMIIIFSGIYLFVRSFYKKSLSQIKYDQ